MPEFAVVFIRRAWPAAVVVLGWLGYSVWIFASHAASGDMPSAQLNSVVVASAVICSVFAATYIVVGAVGVNRRCDCRPEVAGLAERVQEVEERLSAPQQVYMVPAQPKPSDVRHEGLGPDAIDALRRMNRQIHGVE